MAHRDPLDEYAELLAEENRTNDELLEPAEYFSRPENLASYLRDAAVRFEAESRRHVAEREAELGRGRHNLSAG